MEENTEEKPCNVCEANKGNKRINPGPTIHEGVFWLVEHAYPSKLKGWLVLSLKRHVTALHDMSPEEFQELGVLIGKTTRILHEALDTEKEYAMCFAEIDGFEHIHFHIAPKSKYLPEEFKGTKIFTLLKVSEEEAIPKEAVIEFCEELQKKY